jgi:hypothetical protein
MLRKENNEKESVYFSFDVPCDASQPYLYQSSGGTVCPLN